MARGSLPTNIFIDSPNSLLANPDDAVPEVGLNPLSWKDAAKHKLQQTQTRKKIFLDIGSIEGIKDADKIFDVDCEQIYQQFCSARYRAKKDKLKLVTTRGFGEKMILTREFQLVSQYLVDHPLATISWNIENLQKTHVFACFAELGTPKLPLSFAQLTVRFESNQSILLNPNKEAAPPAAKPPKHIKERIVFERCLTRKGSSWRICALLPDTPQPKAN